MAPSQKSQCRGGEAAEGFRASAFLDRGRGIGIEINNGAGYGKSIAPGDSPVNPAPAIAVPTPRFRTHGCIEDHVRGLLATEPQLQAGHAVGSPDRGLLREDSEEEERTRAAGKGEARAQIEHEPGASLVR